MNKRIFIIIILFSIHANIYSQIKHVLHTKQIIIKFKQEFKANSIYYVNNKKFNNKHLNQLNKDNNVKSIKLTGNIKDKRTYAIELKSNKSYKEIIKMYNNTGQFEYVEGTPSDDPKEPQAPVDAVEIASLELPAFVRNVKDNNDSMKYWMKYLNKTGRR